MLAKEYVASIMLGMCLTSSVFYDSNQTTQNTIEYESQPIVTIHQEELQGKSRKEEIKAEMKERIKNITPTKKEDRKAWFIKYKKIVEEYSDLIKTETIYDKYTSNEISLLLRVVQSEVGDEHSFTSKVNVASVILNRLASEDFPNTIDEVLTKRQFQCISNGQYKKVEVSEETRLAVEYAFMIGDTTNGALYYMNKKWSTKSNIRWFENNLTYIFTDSANHSFFR